MPVYQDFTKEKRFESSGNSHVFFSLATEKVINFVGNRTKNVINVGTFF